MQAAPFGLRPCAGLVAADSLPCYPPPPYLPHAHPLQSSAASASSTANGDEFDSVKSK